MNKDQFLTSGLLEQYALGITSEEESALVEQYLSTSPEVRSEYTSMRKALDQYAKQYAIQPPEVLRDRVMEAVDHQHGRSQDYNEPLPSGSKGGLSQFGWSRLLTYPAILLMGVGLFLLDRKADGLQQELSAQTILLDACQEEKANLESSSTLFAFLKHGQTQQVSIKGTQLSPKMRLIAYWNEATSKAYLNPVNLPAPPKGKQYQIWADVNGKMISVGLLNRKLPLDQLATISFIEKAESLNLTLEPEGGSEEPTVSLLVANGII